MLETIQASLSGLVGFGLYFGSSIVALGLFKVLYTFATPHDEWELVKEKKSVAAGWAMGGAVIGFCIALAGAASNSVSIIDFGIWATVALIAQLVAYVLVKLFFPAISRRIEDDEVAAGIVLASVSIGIGVLNAACMTY